jgi:hypothetical protein
MASRDRLQGVSVNNAVPSYGEARCGRYLVEAFGRCLVAPEKAPSQHRPRDVPQLGEFRLVLHHAVPHQSVKSDRQSHQLGRARDAFAQLQQNTLCIV